MLTAADCCSKNIFVGAVVIPELKFRDVKRQIFGADLVEAANDAAFARPETFNRVGVNRTYDVFLAVMVNRLVIVFFVQAAIHAALIGRQQANFVRYHFANEGFCQVKQRAYLLRRLNDGLSPEVAAAEEAASASPSNAYAVSVPYGAEREA